MSSVRWSRKDYMAGRCSHREYYSQYVTSNVRSLVSSAFGSRLEKSEDDSFNDIPLPLWDSVGKHILADVCRMNEETTGSRSASASDLVCVLKEAARQILEKDGKDAGKSEA